MLTRPCAHSSYDGGTETHKLTFTDIHNIFMWAASEKENAKWWYTIDSGWWPVNSEANNGISELQDHAWANLRKKIFDQLEKSKTYNQLQEVLVTRTCTNSGNRWNTTKSKYYCCSHSTLLWRLTCNREKEKKTTVTFGLFASLYIDTIWCHGIMCALWQSIYVYLAVLL